MIRSMTGFAAVSRQSEADTVHVTVKSVNHRFLDVAVKVPASLGGFDQRLKVLVGQRLGRGRIELSVTADIAQAVSREVVVDEALVGQLATAIERLRARGLVMGPLAPSDVLRLPQVVEVRTALEPAGSAPESVAALVDAATSQALDALITMRETEGRLLGADLSARLATLGALVTTLEREAGDGQRTLGDRLRERIAGLPADLAIDPAAVAQEVVRFVARSDIDEEVVRLRAHFEHWRTLADGPEPCGRKLDFLVQEMNREINTIGSKVEGTRGTEAVIAAKAELERLKEQVQNVE